MKQKRLLAVDWWLLTPVIILIIIGMTTMFSLQSTLFFNQLFTLSIGIIGFLVASQIRTTQLRLLTVPMYVLSVFLLILVLALGFEARGAVRWVYIFGFPIQFSEVLKPLVAASIAGILYNKSNTSLRTYLTALVLLVPIFLLITIQPDLGNALIYAGVIGFVLLVFGFPLKWFVITALPFIFSAPFLWNAMHEYQRQRVMTFLNPTSDPLGTSYNVIQAMIAVGSGMFLGKGLSQGTQSGLQFLPERHTDFIFATISEGMGFAGAFIIILAFLALCYRIYMIYSLSDDTYDKLFAVGAFGFILIHFFVNIAMNIGLLPIVGVTLPFVSYGGSSLLSNFIILGILSSISVHNRRRTVLEIR